MSAGWCHHVKSVSESILAVAHRSTARGRNIATCNRTTTTRWQKTNLPSRSYGVAASQARLIHCDSLSYHSVWGKVIDFSDRQSMHAFNQSLKYDQRMHAADIRGSIAYAKALTLVGVLTKDEESKIVQGLIAVGDEWQNGQVVFTKFLTTTS